MSKYQDFEELPVWRDATRLYNSVFDLREQPQIPSLQVRNRLEFLRNLKPEHPLYRSSEARVVRGEIMME